MTDSPSKWKNNGLPRKGWKIHDVIDLDSANGECEWCGTSIRYVHHLIHADDLETKCGCICAEHLTDDYINPRKMEKDLKAKLRAKKTELKKFLRSFKLGKKSFYSHFFGINKFIIIFKRQDGNYYLKIGEQWGSNAYSDFNAAKLAAYQFLTN